MQAAAEIVDGPAGGGRTVRVEPDLDFIAKLRQQGGASLKHCFQCGTCSATCALSSDLDPFPRQEMAWAVWGMKDRLLGDPKVWLCHQCNDCSERCPRGARPGDVLGTVRQQCVEHYAFPGFLGRWMGRVEFIPLLLGIPVALLTLALYLRGPLGDALGFSAEAGTKIVFPYSSIFPHWLLNGFFGLFSLLALLAVIVGVGRFWKAMHRANPMPGRPKGMLPSILATLRRVFAHEDFTECSAARLRYSSHICVMFGFLALCVVTLWVITGQINPLIRGDFIYPFSFFSPWKMLANLGGAALLAGCLIMAYDRLREDAPGSLGSYFDWLLLAELFLVVLTGFITYALHYLRLEPHRHIAYFMHLVFVFTLLIYLPYSKFAHLAYRFAALVFVERSGWREAISGGKDDAKPTA